MGRNREMHRTMHQIATTKSGSKFLYPGSTLQSLQLATGSLPTPPISPNQTTLSTVIKFLHFRSSQSVRIMSVLTPFCGSLFTQFTVGTTDPTVFYDCRITLTNTFSVLLVSTIHRFVFLISCLFGVSIDLVSVVPFFLWLSKCGANKHFI